MCCTCLLFRVIMNNYLFFESHIVFCSPLCVCALFVPNHNRFMSVHPEICTFKHTTSTKKSRNIFFAVVQPLHANLSWAVNTHKDSDLLKLVEKATALVTDWTTFLSRTNLKWCKWCKLYTYIHVLAAMTSSCTGVSGVRGPCLQGWHCVSKLQVETFEHAYVLQKKSHVHFTETMTWSLKTPLTLYAIFPASSHLCSQGASTDQSPLHPCKYTFKVQRVHAIHKSWLGSDNMATSFGLLFLLFLIQGGLRIVPWSWKADEKETVLLDCGIFQCTHHSMHEAVILSRTASTTYINTMNCAHHAKFKRVIG